MTTPDRPDTTPTDRADPHEDPGLVPASPSELPPLDDPRFVEARVALGTAERMVDEARRARAEAKARVAVALHEAARPYRDREHRLPIETISHLYWDRPELRVTDIAAAFGLLATGVRTLAGPRVVEVDCADCLTPVHLVRRSRSHHPARSGVRCGPCLDRNALASMEWDPHGSSAGPSGRGGPWWDGERWDDRWDEPPPADRWR
jgi:hypothetical protein